MRLSCLYLGAFAFFDVDSAALTKPHCAGISITSRLTYASRVLSEN